VFGIDGGEFVVLALLALFLIGPERLPGLAQQAARALHDLRRWTQRTRDDIGRELGPEFENFDLADLNPRRFVQKHLLDPLTDEDDERPLVPQVHGHASLASRSAGADAADAAVVGGHGPAGGGHTVSLSKALGTDLDDLEDFDGGVGAGRPQPIGPRITTDVFAEPRVVTAGAPARSAVAVPAWGDTASARAEADDDHDADADADGADVSWATAFYFAPVFDTEAT